MPWDLILSMFQSASIQGSRSTAMGPLVWAIGILVGGSILFQRVGMPAEAIWILIGLLVIVVGVFLGLYIYFAKKKPDLLRSERYVLTKMAIQQGRRGDDR